MLELTFKIKKPDYYGPETLGVFFLSSAARSGDFLFSAYWANALWLVPEQANAWLPDVRARLPVGADLNLSSKSDKSWEERTGGFLIEAKLPGAEAPAYFESFEADGSPSFGESPIEFLDHSLAKKYMDSIDARHRGINPRPLVRIVTQKSNTLEGEFKREDLNLWLIT